MRAQALFAATVVLALAAGCPSRSGSDRAPASGEGSGDPLEGVEPSFTILATTELRGQLEPCGCSTQPHGDIARTAKLLERARERGEVLFVDGGSTLYSSPAVPAERVEQEREKADFIAGLLASQLDAAAVGIGPYDLAEGPDRVRPPRAAVNLPEDGEVELAPPAIATLGDVRVGVFGVVSPRALADLEVDIGDPIAAAAEATSELREQGAEAVLAIAHMTASEAEELATRVDGIDFLLVGQNAPEPDRVEPGARRVGGAWLFQPANRGQVLTQIDVGMSGEGAFTDALGPARARAERARLEAQAEATRENLATWRADPDADPEFVAARERELAELEEEISALEQTPVRIPDDGNWFMVTQVPVTRDLDCQVDVQAEKTALDAAIGEANLELLADREPEPPSDEQARFVGKEACSFCHEEAVEFWRDSAHAAAWDTLETYGKQYDLDCVSCHVTGYDEPGGSTLAHTEGLRDVQCEVCHGPGSLHVAADGNEEPSSLTRTPPDTLCVTCHNEEHSDTFDYVPYLRDVTGEGHGEAFRASLGDGVTGNELRSRALAEAGEGVGEGCLK